MIMKRIKAACITQTLHFSLKEDVGHDYAAKCVSQDVKNYKDQLNRSGGTLFGLAGLIGAVPADIFLWAPCA